MKSDSVKKGMQTAPHLSIFHRNRMVSRQVSAQRQTFVDYSSFGFAHCYFLHYSGC